MSEKFLYFQKSPLLNTKIIKIKNAIFHHVSVNDKSSKFFGFGSDRQFKIAQTKALFEMIERTVFFRTENNSTTSSGWAAHTKIEDAILNAKFELLERDALLVSWLLKLSPKQIGLCRFPLFESDFQLFKLGEGEGFLILGTILKVTNDNKMLITTCAKNLDEAKEKLLADSEKAFLILNNQNLLTNSEIKSHHSSFCRLNESEYDWIYKAGTGIQYNLNDFKFHIKTFEVPLWDKSVAFVIRSRCNQLQNLYYGNKHFKNINRNRLKELVTTSIKINRNLHPLL